MDNITIREDQCVPISQIITHYGYKASDARRLPIMTLIYLLRKYYADINH